MHGGATSAEARVERVVVHGLNVTLNFPFVVLDFQEALGGKFEAFIAVFRCQAFLGQRRAVLEMQVLQ